VNCPPPLHAVLPCNLLRPRSLPTGKFCTKPVAACAAFFAYYQLIRFRQAPPDDDDDTDDNPPFARKPIFAIAIAANHPCLFWKLATRNWQLKTD
ncbi:MAG: hypothetical protein K8L97_14465, partial [Anaerolineae bacterium]|nr:hypothetical protein [Anaerolineae bacterium]